MKDKNEKEPLKKKEYVKPTVVKHTAASVVVGSCNTYSSNTDNGGNYYY